MRIRWRLDVARHARFPRSLGAGIGNQAWMIAFPMMPGSFIIWFSGRDPAFRVAPRKQQMVSSGFGADLHGKLEEAWSRFFPEALWFMSRDAATDPANISTVIKALRSGSLEAFRFAAELERLSKQLSARGGLHADRSHPGRDPAYPGRSSQS